jgi:anti-sigma B factor antagonist
MTETHADVETTDHRGRPLVRVRGEVDMANADLVGAQIRAAGSPTGAITLDLSRVEFFDSSGLRMLQQLSDDVEREGGRLTVVTAPESIVGRLLTLTNMDAYIHVSGALPA